MKIGEMEALIDRLGLEKLEVRLKKGHEVDYFICAINNDKEGEFTNDYEHKGNIVVFDNDGRCWETGPDAHWSKDGDYELFCDFNEFLQFELSSINGYRLERMPQHDLDPIGD